MFSVNKNPAPRDLKVFAGGMLVGLPLLATVFYFISRARLAEGTQPSRTLTVFLGALAVAGIVVGVAALVFPRLGRSLYIGWMTATLPIGIAMSTVVLTVLYFLLLPVFSLLVRRKDPLRKKLGGETYWEDYRPHEPTLERMRRPF